MGTGMRTEFLKNGDRGQERGHKFGKSATGTGTEKLKMGDRGQGQKPWGQTSRGLRFWGQSPGQTVWGQLSPSPAHL